MQILFNPQYTNLQFQGRNDTFWKAYNREMNGIPLKDTILKSISDENNLLGEASLMLLLIIANMYDILPDSFLNSLLFV